MRIYILPIVRELEPDGVTFDRHPKYVYKNTLFDAWSGVDYGTENVCILGVPNSTTFNHDYLTANNDVFSLPEDIDQLMTGNAVNTAQTFLESLNIPANWIDATKTYREVIKVIIGLFQFNQRWAGLTFGLSSPFTEGLDLNTRFNQMNFATKTNLQACFDTLNIDRSALNNTSTIREVLIEFGHQFSAREIKLAGEIL